MSFENFLTIDGNFHDSLMFRRAVRAMDGINNHLVSDIPQKIFVLFFNYLVTSDILFTEFAAFMTFC
jgi:hypothetical protein